MGSPSGARQGAGTDRMTVLEGDIDALEGNGAKTEPANRMTASPRISTLLPARKINRMW